MNGYSNNGFVKSFNGILSITDGLGTKIENGTIITEDIAGEDIIADTITINSGTFVNMLSNSMVSLNCGIATLNSSNLITTVNLLCNYINCKTIKLNSVANHFTDK